MDAAAAEELVRFIRHERLVIDHIFVSALALLIYDHLLMLPLEIRLVWPSPWSYTKILYLIVRYSSLPTLGLVVYVQSFLDLPEGRCRMAWLIVAWTSTIEINLAEIILAIRTWAIWSRNLIVGIGLALLMSASLICQIFIGNRFMKSLIYGPAPYTGYRGCFIEKADRAIWVTYAVGGVLEIIMLVLMIISGVKAYRSGYRNKLSDIIHRDGILFYLYVLCPTIATFFVIVTLPSEFMGMFGPLHHVLYTILTSRIIITIRNASRGDRMNVATELHDRTLELTRQVSPLEFHIHRDGTWS